MKRLIALVAVTVASSIIPLQAQQLLTPGQSFTYEFSGLTDFGDGYPGPARGFATFLIDSARSTAGATYTVDLFENNVGENPLASVTGTGNVTASAPGAFPDERGVV